MPHVRKRYLSAALPHSMAFSPIVGVLGHRQVGKTTLVEALAKRYISLDLKENRELAQKAPDVFLKSYHALPLVIDECQKSPAIFDELKDWVRRSKNPGQFLLTGSVRFTSKKAIRESLTGRILYHELLPFTVSEIMHRALPNRIRSLMNAKDLSSWMDSNSKNAGSPAAIKKAILDYQTCGGLPGVFSIRNEKLRAQKIYDQLQTILDRDLREIVSTRISSSQIFEFAESLAMQEGVPLSYSKLLKDTGVANATAKKIIAALEAVFLIRLLKVEGGKKGHIFFFEDQAESHYLSAGKLDSLIYYAGFLYRNVRAEFVYSGECQFRFFHYLTKHNTRIPFAVEWNGKSLGFLPLREASPSHGELMAAQSFLKQYGDAKVLMIHPEAKTKDIGERILILADSLLF